MQEYNISIKMLKDGSIVTRCSMQTEAGMMASNSNNMWNYGCRDITHLKFVIFSESYILSSLRQYVGYYRAVSSFFGYVVTYSRPTLHPFL